jgi:hypothetical protein
MRSFPSSRSFRSVLAAAAFVSLAVSGFAQASETAGGGSDETSSDAAYPDIGWYDLHNHNRAVAFGSLLMQSGGGDVGAWQEVRAYGWCEAEGGAIGMPLPSRPVDDGTSAGGNGNGNDGGDGGSDDYPPSKCGWSVLFTTHYELQVCPNGRAFILRSGEGVNVKSRTEGDLFAWMEAAFCDDGPTLSASNSTDPHRVLDLKRVSKVPMR